METGPTSASPVTSSAPAPRSLLAMSTDKAEEPVKPPDRSSALSLSDQTWGALSWIGMDRAAGMKLVIPSSPSVTACPPSVYEPSDGAPEKSSEFNPKPLTSLVLVSHVAGALHEGKPGKVRSRFDSSLLGAEPPQFPDCDQSGEVEAPDQVSEVSAPAVPGNAPNTPTKATVTAATTDPANRFLPMPPLFPSGTAGAVFWAGTLGESPLHPRHG